MTLSTETLSTETLSTEANTELLYKSIEGNQPLMAAAIHNGHELRDEVAKIMALDEESRFREEDPYTGMLTTLAQNQLVVYRSRFEVDLNRPRKKAVYLVPEDAWGLEVWMEPPGDGLITRSLQEYDGFYSHVHKICTHMEKEFGRFAVLDLHSYNHRRQGAEAPPADPDENPEVNIGTGTMNREKWADLVDRFIQDLRAFDYFGRRLDVRENVKFRGGGVDLLLSTVRDSCCPPLRDTPLGVEFGHSFALDFSCPQRDRLFDLRVIDRARAES